MRFTPTLIEGCYFIEPETISDERGWFARIYCENEAKPFLGDLRFVQINHSFNHKKGTFRGMHYQLTPFSEGKLIRCIAGAVMDYVLDLRKDSPTLMKWIAVELSAANRKMIYLPKGMAHGFQSLYDNTELLYHHTEFYEKNAEGGIRYNDPLINIVPSIDISIINEKDKNYPLLTNNFKGIEL